MNYSKIRREQQAAGTLPNWYTTAGFQLINEKSYIAKGETVKDRYSTIARTLSKHMPRDNWDEYEKIFFDLLWDGLFSLSTPAYTNIGTNFGLPIACSGSYVIDSVDGFYKVANEIANLSKHGFGTSAYLGDVRPRGTPISTGGVADGVVPVMELMFNTARHISQSSQRRGSVACYLPLDHGDFWEAIHYIENNPDGTNVGWTFTDDIEKALDSGDVEMHKRYKEMLSMRLQGTGYIHMVDKSNRLAPRVYKDNFLRIKASNLCSEIMLHSSEDLTYTCCLGSVNVAKWNRIVELDYKPIHDSIILLDCINSEFIKVAKNMTGMEKVVKFAEWSRPVGLGQMGLSTYFQENDIQFDGLDGQFKNTEICKIIAEQSHTANIFLGSLLGESPLMKGTGLRMSHTNAIAPTMSTALIMGGVSNGIEPFFANIFTQTTAGGDVRRANPVVVKMMKDKGIWNKENIDRMIADNGSVAGFSEFTQREKDVLKTAFECNKEAMIRMNDHRSQYTDQGVSFNLHVLAGTPEKLIAKWHQMIIKSEYIKSAYYLRSSSGVHARTDMSEEECVACSA